MDKYKNIRRKIFLPVCLVLIILQFIFITCLHRWEKNEALSDFADKVEKAKYLLDYLQEDTAKQLSLINKLIDNDTKMKELWAHGDRAKLLEYCTPQYGELLKDYGIPHFSLINADSKVFFKLHDPESFNETKTGISLSNAKLSNKFAYGIEPGKDQTFVFKCIFPVKISQDKTGFIELCSNISPMLHKLTKNFDINFISLINKKYINTADFDKKHPSEKSEFLADYVILEQSNGLPVRELEKFLKNRGNPELPQNIYISAIPIKNPSGDEIGELLIFRNYSLPFWQLNILTVSWAALSTFLLIILALLFYYYLTQIERAINRYQNDIEESELRLNQALEGASEGIWDLNIKSSEVLFNPNFYKKLGVEQVPMRGSLEVWYNLIHPDDREATKNSLNDYLTGKAESYSHICRILSSKNDISWIHSRGKILEWDKDGKPLRMLGTHTNVTNEIMMENRLKATEKRFSDVINAITEHIMIITSDYKILWANPAAEEFYGQNLSGCDYYSLFPDERNYAKGIITQTITSGSSCYNITFRKLENGVKKVFRNLTNILECKHDGTPASVIKISHDITEEFNEQEKTGRVLIESALKLQSLFDDSPIGIIECDFTEVKKYIDSLKAAGTDDFKKFFDENPSELLKCFSKIKVLNSNQEALRMSESANIEALKNDFIKIIQTMPLNVLQNIMISLAKDRKFFESETEHTSGKGNKFYSYMKIHVTANYKNGYVRVIALMIDMTEQKLNQEALKASQLIFAEAINTSFDSFYLVEPLKKNNNEIEDFIVREVNKKGIELYGKPREFIINKKVSELLPSYKKTGLFGKLVNIYKTKKPEFEEFQNNLPEINALWLQYQIMPVGNMLALSLRDVTARMIGTQNLKMLEQVINRSPATVFIWNDDLCTIELVSANVENMLGYKPAEFMTNKVRFRDLIHPDDRARVENEQAKAKTMNDFVQEYRMQTKTGAICWVNVHIWNRKNKSGQITRYEGILIDITSRKRVEQELRSAKVLAEAANKAKSLFLANMSHEIRTPMNAIIGFSEILLGTNLTAEQKENLEIIKKRGEDLLGLINHILDYSKIEAGKLELKYEPLNLEQAIKDLYDTFKIQTAEKHLALSFSIDPDVPKEIKTDSLRLKQILINLISNALKFTEKGSITVNIAKGKGPILSGETTEKKATNELFLYFTVKDTGIGIPEEKIDSIFEDFTQVDNTASRKYGGAGLGLAICKKLTALMDGKIWVESNSQGSKFHFIIKTEASQVLHEKKEGNIPSHTPDNLASKKVSLLLTEDEPTNRLLMQKILQTSGLDIELTLAANGLDALAALEKNPDINIILMDIQMPEMDGLTATSIIRDNELKTGRHIPIIALTAHAGLEHVKQCYTTGMDAHLPKPVKKQQLLEMIAKVLAKNNYS